MVHFCGRFENSQAAYRKTAENCSGPVRRMSLIMEEGVFRSNLPTLLNDTRVLYTITFVAYS